MTLTEERIPSVLCVEDEDLLRGYICDELAEDGYTVLSARNGREGLEKILAHKPDLVISDITMPEMTGTELVKEIRNNHSQFAEMPFVFLSALNDKENIVDGLDAGADDYLTKPVDFQILRSKVATALRQRRRLKDRKRDEHVKIFKALAVQETAGEGGAQLAVPPQSFVLVGEGCSEVSAIQAQMEALGQSVRLFTSGRNFLTKLGELKFDAALLWAKSDDMKGPELLNLAKKSGVRSILVMSAKAAQQFQGKSIPGALDILPVPISNDGLAEKISRWSAM